MSYVPPSASSYEAQFTHSELFTDYSPVECIAFTVAILFSEMQEGLRNFVATIQLLVTDWTSKPIEKAEKPDSKGPLESSALDISGFLDEFNVDGDDGFSQKAQRALANINEGTQIRGGTTSTYMDLLEKQYGQRASFIHALVSEVLPDSSNFVENYIKPVVEDAVIQGKDFVFIPVVFQSTVEPHNVLYIVNIKDQVIEYYDPKGTEIGDRKIPLLDKSVREFSEELRGALEGVPIQQSESLIKTFSIQ
ncbi:hypothetical protein [Simkania sp.]|uniref:hypothetical protein n=1 Tax=Simkania sp. TaxID=34094 RepID=UPI003B519F6C